MQQNEYRYEWMILDRFREILNHPQTSGFAVRYVKSGDYRRHPVRIYDYSFHGMNHLLPLRADSVAHLLTSSKNSAAGIIKNIIIWPQFEHTRQSILTHLWDGKTESLIFYLYPGSWNEPVKVRTSDRFRDTYAWSPGLAQTVISTVGANKHEEFLIFTAQTGLLQKKEMNDLITVSDQFKEIISLRHEYFS